MRIVFFGGSEISIPFAESLLKDIVLIVTLPPKVRGRGSQPKQNPLKEFADNHKIDVIEVETFSEDVIFKVKSYNPDSFVVFSFGKIIPETLLEITSCPLNIHPSNLPMYRGASPIERQLMDGVKESAVTVMKMNAQIDKGEIILKKTFDVSLFDDYFSFLQKVYEFGIPLIKEALDCCMNRTCNPIPQEGKGSYARKITSEEEKIDWSKDALSIHNKVRALTRIGAFALFRNKKLKIFKTEPLVDFKSEYEPGTIVEVKKDGIIVSTGEGAIKIISLQPEGKKSMSVSDFINGYRPHVLEVMR